MKTINGVTIGDKFISPKYPKSKKISTVIDFVERRSLSTGEVISYECWASHELLGQTIKFETPFSSVVRNKIN